MKSQFSSSIKSNCEFITCVLPNGQTSKSLISRTRRTRPLKRGPPLHLIEPSQPDSLTLPLPPAVLVSGRTTHHVNHCRNAPGTKKPSAKIDARLDLPSAESARSADQNSDDDLTVLIRRLAADCPTAFYADLWPRGSVFGLHCVFTTSPNRPHLFVSCSKTGFIRHGTAIMVSG